MVKKIILLAILSILFVCFGIFSQEITERKPIVAVMDLETNNVSEKEMQSLISMIANNLFKTGQYTVIDVAERDMILEEIKFSMTGCTDESCQIEVGKMLSAENIVSGSIMKIGEQWVISLKMLETSTTRTIGGADGIYTSIDELVNNLMDLTYMMAGLDPDDFREESEIDINKVLAWSTLGGGVTIAGAGITMFFIALNSLTAEGSTVLLARDKYLAASGSDDFPTLYEEYLGLQADAVNLHNAGIIVGGIGAAVALSSLFFFLAPEDGATPAGKDNQTVQLSFSPDDKLTGIRLALSLKY